ncbi:MAG: multiheme c-type cytochrome [Paracoccaceae bacterium]
MKLSFAIGAALAALAWLVVPSASSAQTAQKVMGAISCTASGCHELGVNEADPESNVERNEFQVWSQTDGHAQSYLSLTTAQARKIARNLREGDPESSPYCLSCHALDVSAHLQGENYNIEEGVTCEACHGAAGEWLETHSDYDVPIETVRKQGLFPTENPVARAGMCLDCHLGNNDVFAGHRLLAAGHPRTGFELASDTRLTAHFVVDDDYKERKEPLPEATQWALGQAVAVERRMDLLASPKTGTIGFFPQLAFFECHSCHKPMSVKRQNNVNKRGTPALHDANIKMLRLALNSSAPGASDRIERGRRALQAATGKNRQALVRAAINMRQSAREAILTMSQRDFSAGELDQLLRTFVRAGGSGSYTDFASAEQLMKSVDWTIFAMRDAGAVDEQTFRDLYALQTPVFESVESDDRYSARAFSRAMQTFSRSLPARVN